MNDKRVVEVELDLHQIADLIAGKVVVVQAITHIRLTLKKVTRE